MIHAASEEMFEITWIPLFAGAWRDVIQLTDHGRIKRDIPIVFKSIKVIITNLKVNLIKKLSIFM